MSVLPKNNLWGRGKGSAIPEQQLVIKLNCLAGGGIPNDKVRDASCLTWGYTCYSRTMVLVWVFMIHCHCKSTFQGALKEVHSNSNKMLLFPVLGLISASLASLVYSTSAGPFPPHRLVIKPILF